MKSQLDNLVLPKLTDRGVPNEKKSIPFTDPRNLYSSLQIEIPDDDKLLHNRERSHPPYLPSNSRNIPCVSLIKTLRLDSSFGER